MVFGFVHWKEHDADFKHNMCHIVRRFGCDLIQYVQIPRYLSASFEIQSIGPLAPLAIQRVRAKRSAGDIASNKSREATCADKRWLDGNLRQLIK